MSKLDRWRTQIKNGFKLKHIQIICYLICYMQIFDRYKTVIWPLYLLLSLTFIPFLSHLSHGAWKQGHNLNIPFYWRNGGVGKYQYFAFSCLSAFIIMLMNHYWFRISQRSSPSPSLQLQQLANDHRRKLLLFHLTVFSMIANSSPSNLKKRVEKCYFRRNLE